MKRERDQLQIDVFKERFRNDTLRQLRLKLAFGYLTTPERVAIRQLIEEKANVDVSHEYSPAEIEAIQRDVCVRVNAEYQASPPELKVGIAIETLDLLPLNGLRHPPADGTTGWFIWGGERFSTDPQFFVPLHVAQLSEQCPDALPYLGLAPGWRFLIAPEYENVWFDASLLVLDRADEGDLA